MRTLVLPMVLWAAGCMPPPTSLGLRSSGDLLPEAQPVEVGAFGGVATFDDAS